MAMISQIDFLLPKEKDLFFLIVVVNRNLLNELHSIIFLYQPALTRVLSHINTPLDFRWETYI